MAISRQKAGKLGKLVGFQTFASPAGGPGVEITLKSGDFDLHVIDLVRAKAEDDYAILSVADNGVGISAELLPRIFDLFVQGEQRREGSHSGLGIGMALVRHLANLHGGTVEVASDGPGRGSVFTVRLPSIPAPSSEPGLLAQKAIQTPTRRILLVEDNRDVRESFREALELSGHEVLESGDGPSGVETALAALPDVALIDIALPGIDGYEVARRIRSAPEGHQIFLIAVTGYGEPQDRRRAEEAGFDLHLVKPVDFERLSEALATARPTHNPSAASAAEKVR